jgi:hypothetical protein
LVHASLSLRVSKPSTTFSFPYALKDSMVFQWLMDMNINVYKQSNIAHHFHILDFFHNSYALSFQHMPSSKENWYMVSTPHNLGIHIK